MRGDDKNFHRFSARRRDPGEKLSPVRPVSGRYVIRGYPRSGTTLTGTRRTVGIGRPRASSFILAKRLKHCPVEGLLPLLVRRNLTRVRNGRSRGVSFIQSKLLRSAGLLYYRPKTPLRHFSFRRFRLCPTADPARSRSRSASWFPAKIFI